MDALTRLPLKLRPASAASACAQTAPPELLEFVDFKWLMAGEGHAIDLDRLQRESAYARGCMALAGGSTSATLRRAGERLASAMGISRRA